SFDPSASYRSPLEGCSTTRFWQPFSNQRPPARRPLRMAVFLQPPTRPWNTNQPQRRLSCGEALVAPIPFARWLRLSPLSCGFHETSLCYSLEKEFQNSYRAIQLNQSNQSCTTSLNRMEFESTEKMPRSKSAHEVTSRSRSTFTF